VSSDFFLHIVCATTTRAKPQRQHARRDALSFALHDPGATRD